MTDLPNTLGVNQQNDLNDSSSLGDALKSAINDTPQVIPTSPSQPLSLNQNTVSNNNQIIQQAEPIQTQQVVVPITPVLQPIQPVGSVGGKEKAIIPNSEIPVEDVGSLPELSAELKETGIEKVSETIELPQSVVKAGLTHTGPTIDFASENPLPVKIPLTDDQIQKGLHQKVADSILWLAYWCLRQVKVAHARILKKETI